MFLNYLDRILAQEAATLTPIFLVLPRHYRQMPRQYLKLIRIGSTSLIILPFKGQGHEGAWLVEALCYKPEGRGFDSR
jgi:hypothetical protein